MSEIYLDNAASTFPKPREVADAMYRAMIENTANAGRSGHRLSAAAEKKIFGVRSLAAEFFGRSGKEENVIFTQNATHAINLALFGTLKRGNRVIITDTEHNSVLRPLKKLGERGVVTDIADTKNGKIAENIEKLIRPETRLVFMTHASNVSGEIFPIEKIGEICRRHHLLFGVDASQTAGHIGINAKKTGIDLLCMPGHKGLMGPQGTGILIVSDRVTAPEPLIYGGTGSASLSDLQPGFLPDALESGTLNGVGIIGMGEGIKFCKREMKKTEQNIRFLTSFCCSELQKIDGITLYSEPGGNSGVVSFSYGNIHSEKIAAYLDSDHICVRGGYHCAYLFHHTRHTEKNGLVRASFGPFSKERDVIVLINSLKRLNLSE